MNKDVLVFIVGSIGAGKTTILRSTTSAIENTEKYQQLNLKTISEPVDTHWKHQCDSGISMLEMYYKSFNSKDTHGMLNFQVYAGATRMLSIQNALASKKLGNAVHSNEEGSAFIVDGSIFSDAFIFYGMLKTMFTQTQNITYITLFETWLVYLYNHFKIGLIFVNTSPEICIERIKTRGRTEEKDISLDYLHTIQKRLDDMEAIATQAGIPFIKLDNSTNVNLKDDNCTIAKTCEEHFEKILSFIDYTDKNYEGNISLMSLIVKQLKDK